MTKRVMNAIGKAVAEEMGNRGLNQKNLFMTNVAANLASAVVMTAVSMTMNGVVDGVRKFRENRAAENAADQLEEEFEEVVTDGNFCEVPPVGSAASASTGEDQA